MSLLPAATLTNLQTIGALIFDQTCTVQRITSPGETTIGDATETYTTVASSVPCGVIKPAGSYQTNIEMRQATQNNWDILFAVNFDVRQNDHLIIGSDTLVVQTVNIPMSYEIHLHVLASEVY